MKRPPRPKITSDTYQKLLISENIISSQNLFQETLDIIKKPPNERTNNDKLFLVNELNQLSFFNSFFEKQGLENSQNLMNYLSYQYVQQNTVIYSDRDISKRFFVILKGKVRLSIPKVFTTTSVKKLIKQSLNDEQKESSIIQYELQEGQSFGENELLLPNCRLSIAETTGSNCHLLSFNQSAFIQFFQMYFLKTKPYFLENNFSKLVPRQIKILLSYHLTTKQITYNQTIYNQGDLINDIFYIIEGQVTLSKPIEYKLSNTPYSKSQLLKKQVQISSLSIEEFFGDDQLNEEYSYLTGSSNCSSALDKSNTITENGINNNKPNFLQQSQCKRQFTATCSSQYVLLSCINSKLLLMNMHSFYGIERTVEILDKYLYNKNKWRQETIKNNQTLTNKFKDLIIGLIPSKNTIKKLNSNRQYTSLSRKEERDNDSSCRNRKNLHKQQNSQSIYKNETSSILNQSDIEKSSSRLLIQNNSQFIFNTGSSETLSNLVNKNNNNSDKLKKIYQTIDIVQQSKSKSKQAFSQPSDLYQFNKSLDYKDKLNNNNNNHSFTQYGQYLDDHLPCITEYSQQKINNSFNNNDNSSLLQNSLSIDFNKSQIETNPLVPNINLLNENQDFYLQQRYIKQYIHNKTDQSIEKLNESPSKQIKTCNAQMEQQQSSQQKQQQKDMHSQQSQVAIQQLQIDNIFISNNDKDQRAFQRFQDKLQKKQQLLQEKQSLSPQQQQQSHSPEQQKINSKKLMEIDFDLYRKSKLELKKQGRFDALTTKKKMLQRMAGTKNKIVLDCSALMQQNQQYNKQMKKVYIDQKRRKHLVKLEESIKQGVDYGKTRTVLIEFINQYFKKKTENIFHNHLSTKDLVNNKSNGGLGSHTQITNFMAYQNFFKNPTFTRLQQSKINRIKTQLDQNKSANLLLNQ